uniref:Uncharacterized protein n=1 Tax=Anguilla anguilla TaxID=7936 RepID=A0A0E9WTM4_ANGAN
MFHVTLVLVQIFNWPRQYLCAMKDTLDSKVQLKNTQKPK